MILSISQTQTTLYDELRYSGDPESFAWVLPISGVVDLGISSDGLFSTLDAMTAVQVIPPPLNCPAPPYDCSRNSFEDQAPSASAGSGGSGGVMVIAQETVGPYETVQLRATDPNSLNEWLTSRGYVIPEDIKPVIQQYVTEKFDFLALKLVPGTGVQAMRPVRVTSQGASAVLPLRMVAAGTGANVGVQLWTVAEGRYEPQNFPSFVIKAEDLVWDWSSYTSNLTTLRTERAATLGGRGWEVESSVTFPPDQVKSAIINGYCQPYQGGYNGGYNGGGGGASPAIASSCSGGQNNYEAEDGGTGPERTKQVVQDEDIATLLAGINYNVRITRTRSALSKAALDRDLVLVASADQTDLAPARKVTRELNQPTCTVYRGCESVGQAPRDEAIAKSDFSQQDESFSCTTSHREGRANSVLTMGAFAALGLLIAKRLRKK
jgi:hypothetical protein